MDPNDREKSAFSRQVRAGVLLSSHECLLDCVGHPAPSSGLRIKVMSLCQHTSTMHAKHLNEVFMRLRKAGLTLRGKKCVIGTPQVTYLGHLFTGSCRCNSRQGESQSCGCDQSPKIATEVRQFLGMASYYRRFIQNFADVAARHSIILPKKMLCSVGAMIAAGLLKCKLIGAPIWCTLECTRKQANFSFKQMQVRLG